MTFSAKTPDESTVPRGQKRLIPTQHSSRGPPPVCRDPVKLQELTQQILETPVGSLFCQNITTKSTTVVPMNNSTRNIEDDRDESYLIARESGELVEYLLRGYNRNISPLTLCGVRSTGDVNPNEPSVLLETMMDIMDRFHKEGEMYQRLRRDTLDYNDTAGMASRLSSTISEDSVGSGRRSIISISGNNDDLDDNLNGKSGDSFTSFVQDKLEVDTQDQQQQQQKFVNGNEDDFALPGVTTNMYDTILDSMACATKFSLDNEQNNLTATNNRKETYLQLLEPNDLYRVAGAAWKAHDLNNQHSNNKIDSGDHHFFPSTVPTMVTYNATLRGVGNLCSAATNERNYDEEQRDFFVDQGLAYGFGVYNHLTHNNHGLPKRNAASVIYLLQIVKSCIPPSRTRGNITVALWHQASMEGLVTPKLIQAIHELHHDNCNGPEFDVFLRSLEKCATPSQPNKKPIITPQRFARFAKKYSHSKFY